MCIFVQFGEKAESYMGRCEWQSDTDVRDDPRSRDDQHSVELLEFPEEIVGRALCKMEIQAINFFLYFLLYKF